MGVFKNYVPLRLLSLITLLIWRVTLAAEIEYPLYCSKVSTEAQRRSYVDHRRIPLLDSRSLSSLELIQVQSVIRHGSRLPLSTNKPCWDGYAPVRSDCSVQSRVSFETYRNSSSAVDSNVGKAAESAIAQKASLPAAETNFLAPSNHPSDSESIILDNLQRVDLIQDLPLAGLVFRKRILQDGASEFHIPSRESSRASLKKFDYAPWSSSSGKDCQDAQLVDEGVVQQTINGKVLAEAYGKWLSKQVPNLTDLVKQVYFRSTDYQRTIASGQFLLTSFFKELGVYEGGEVELELHTMELKRDFLSGEDDCPSAAEAWDRFFEHIEEKLGYDSALNRTMELLKAAGIDKNVAEVFEVQDCLMTTLCSGDRGNLPRAFQTGEDSENISEDLKFVLGQLGHAWSEAFTYNSSAASKSMMHRFWTDAAAFLHKRATSLVPAAALSHAFGELERLFSTSKLDFVPNDQIFVLWSGHDSTIASLLSSIHSKLINRPDLQSDWDSVIPPLASMLVIEFYWDKASETLKFRIIYNNLVVTSSVEGCEDVCELSILYELLSSFVTADTYPSGSCERGGVKSEEVATTTTTTAAAASSNSDQELLAVMPDATFLTVSAGETVSNFVSAAETGTTGTLTDVLTLSSALTSTLSSTLSSTLTSTLSSTMMSRMTSTTATETRSRVPDITTVSTATVAGIDGTTATDVASTETAVILLPSEPPSLTPLMNTTTSATASTSSL